MASGYYNLPGYQAPRNAMLDFSQLNQAVNNYGETTRRNAMAEYRAGQDKLQNTRADAQLGMQQQAAQRQQRQFDAEQEKQALHKLAGIYQHIEAAPEAERQALYQRFQPVYDRMRPRFKEFDDDLRAGGYDPSDFSTVGPILSGMVAGWQDPLDRQYKQAQIDKLNREPAGGEAPSNVREWQYFNKLTPEQQQQYLTMKRAEKYLDTGTGFARPNPVAPGENLSFTPKDVAGAEEQKKLGQHRGEAPQRDAGRQRLTSIMSGMVGDYLELDRMGAIVNTDRNAGENVWARIGASGLGQAISGATGSPEQSIRQRIENSRPLLLQSIMQATGMSARALDSNKELDFYLQAVTDPSRDFHSNLVALDALDKAFGLGGLLKRELPPDLYARISRSATSALQRNPITVQPTPGASDTDAWRDLGNGVRMRIKP